MPPPASNDGPAGFVQGQSSVTTRAPTASRCRSGAATMSETQKAEPSADAGAPRCGAGPMWRRQSSGMLVRVAEMRRRGDPPAAAASGLREESASPPQLRHCEVFPRRQITSMAVQPRGVFRHTSIWCLHDQVHATSMTAKPLGCPPLQRKLRENRRNHARSSQRTGFLSG
jgi:hypothetical protein